MPSTIAVRQIKDPYQDAADVEYIAWSRVTLPDNGQLDLSNLGVGNPGDKFIVIMGPQGFGHPRQGTNIFPLRRMKGSLSYDTASSDPILTVVEQGDRRYAEERHRKSLITQLRSEWIFHLKRLLFQSRTYITSVLFCSPNFLHKQLVINDNSNLVSSSTNNQNLEKVVSPQHENMSVLQHLYLELQQLFLRFKSHSISRRNWGISTKNITQGSSHLYDDKLASAEISWEI